MSNTTKETLLVVDDEKDALELCERVFRDKYNIILANSGEDAVEKAKEVEPAVALVDQRMPGMTGLEFLVGLRDSRPRTSRIVMTAFTDLEDIVAMINLGHIHGFVLKPWNNHQLRVTVSREVENFRRQRTIDELNERLKREHADMLALLREFDPFFEVPQSNKTLKQTKVRLKKKVAGEIERLFLKKLLADNNGNMSATARSAQINRTFLYRLLKRHGLLSPNVEP
ncbi:MAG: response regulator [Deltaproteobacteria bacterium]|nr:response regulator [Deltaproteobacteria bacterium]